VKYVLLIAALILLAHLFSGCASELAQARIAVTASKDMLKLECPQYLASIYPERVEKCANRLLVQQGAEAAYNGWLAADALGSGESKTLRARFTGLIESLLK
jgi:hypothetical protein